MTYKKIQWVNDSEPFLDADNLNHMDEGIEEAHTCLDELKTAQDNYVLKETFTGEVDEITNTISDAQKSILTLETSKADKLSTVTKDELKTAQNELTEAISSKADLNSIPTKLPTPKALTIKLGEVSYIFDGSSVVNVVIENAEDSSY